MMQVGMGLILLVPTLIALVWVYTFIATAVRAVSDREHLHNVRTRFISGTLSIAIICGGWYVIMNMERWESESAQRAYENSPTPPYRPPSSVYLDVDEEQDTYIEDEPSECGYGGWGC